MIGASQQKRLLVLCTTTGYQTCAFIEAAQKLGLSITFGTDRCHVLDDPWQDGALPLRFEDPEASAKRSEEHTSELQSLAYLVCRLLLEKKKKNNTHKIQSSENIQSNSNLTLLATAWT